MGKKKRAGEMPPAAETRVAKQVRRTETMCEQLVTDKTRYENRSEATNTWDRCSACVRLAIAHVGANSSQPWGVIYHWSIPEGGTISWTVLAFVDI